MKHNLFSRFTSVLLAVVLLAGVMSTPILATDSGVPAEAPAATEQTETETTEQTTEPAPVQEATPAPAAEPTALAGFPP